MKPIIAIDGTAGSGKGTIALKLAQHLNFAYLDSGLLYRAFTCAESDLLKNTNQLSAQNIIKAIKTIPASLIRSDAVGMKASALAQNRDIRQKITQIIREFALTQTDKYSGTIIDGRDIGTVVFPDANCKIFMTATPEIRAQRRYASAKLNNPDITFEEIYGNLIRRDEQDTSRNIAPLSSDENYIIIDNSDETIDVTFANILTLVKSKLAIT